MPRGIPRRSYERCQPKIKFFFIFYLYFSKFLSFIFLCFNYFFGLEVCKKLQRVRCGRERESQKERKSFQSTSLLLSLSEIHKPKHTLKTKAKNKNKKQKENKFIFSLWKKAQFSEIPDFSNPQNPIPHYLPNRHFHRLQSLEIQSSIELARSKLCSISLTFSFGIVVFFFFNFFFGLFICCFYLGIAIELSGIGGSRVRFSVLFFFFLGLELLIWSAIRFD